MFPKVPKLPVVIPKGRTRPVSAAIAAKFASECNIAVRNWVPVRSHWNKYKGDTQLLHGYYNRVAVSTYSWSFPLFDVYMQMPACRAVHSYVCFTCHQAKFSMDITASPVKAACRKHLQKGIEQHRHLLKVKYFDCYHPDEVPKTSPVPSMNNSEWNELVQHWMDPKMTVGSFQKSKLLYFVCFCVTKSTMFAGGLRYEQKEPF